MKNDLPFFSHDNNARNHPKMRALIAEYGYEGYGRFWALNERIAETSEACIDISRKVNKLDLAKELGLDGDELDRFLGFLSDPEIDLINFTDGKITTDRISELYKKITEKREKKRTGNQKDKNKKMDGQNGKTDGQNEKMDGQNDREEKRREENKTDKNKSNKKNSSGSDEPPKNGSFAILDREPKNDKERVEKQWLINYRDLYGALPVSPAWSITASRIKKAVDQIGVEKVLQALETAKKDELCLKSGYILKTIMASNVISKLVNARSPPAQVFGTELKSVDTRSMREILAEGARMEAQNESA